MSGDGPPEGQEGTRKRSRFGDVGAEEAQGSSGERPAKMSAAERAKMIAAKLGGFAAPPAASGGPTGGGGMEPMGRAPLPPLPSGGLQIRKKVYVPVRENPDVNFRGLLIGPGGSTHKRLEEDSGAKVKLKGRGSQKDPRLEDDEDLHVLIIGDHEEQVKRAEELVREILFDKDRAGGLKQQQLSDLAASKGAGNGTGRGYVDPNLDTRIVKVRREVVGSIIGRGGDMIRELKDRSGAHIQIDDPEDKSEPMREVQLRGREECVNAAEDMIKKLGSSSSFAVTFTHLVPDSRVGLVIGKAGMTIKAIQSRNQCRIDVPPAGEGVVAGQPGMRELVIKCDSEAGVDQIKREIDEAIGASGDGGPGGGPGAGAQYGGGRGGSEVYPVPNDKAGLLIGKGGATIKMMEMRSGCRIQVPPVSEPGTGMRNVSLIGNPEQCTKARQEIDL
ncbi:Branchpoint-bridging protein (Splicing factor 1), partial [Durusdinium trenchii]